MELTPREARLYVESIGDKLGYEYTYPPHFPNDRRDVAVLEHAAENGSTYGYTQVFAVAKTADGVLRHRELVNSCRTKDYLFIGGGLRHWWNDQGRNPEFRQLLRESVEEDL